MARPMKVTVSAPSTASISLGQTTAAAGPLLINGPLLDLAGTVHATFWARMDPGTQRFVTLSSTGTLSGINFVISGYLQGVAVSQTIAGPSNNVVTTTQLYDTVTSIVASAAVGTTITVGTGLGNTNWLILDNFANPANITVGVEVTGTVSVTVQNTLDSVLNGDPIVTFDHPTLAAIAASAESNYAFPPRNVRAVLNSGTGSFIFTLIQAG